MFGFTPSPYAGDEYDFTLADVAFLSQFTLNALPELPEAPDNKWADDNNAASFGMKLFYDDRLSKNGLVSCASCHQPAKYFTDGLARSQGISITRRSAPSVLGATYSPWLFWDGRKDSLWSQALAPLEHPAEHGLSRAELVKLVIELYRDSYVEVFDSDPKRAIDWQLIKLPASPLGDLQRREHWRSIDEETQETINRIFTNIGKALMAYQRKLSLLPAPFDQFVTALQAGRKQQAALLLSEAQARGLRLFMGQANCISCHNGPLFTNHEFHNIGVPESDRESVDLGRHEGVILLADDEFTCLSHFSDAQEADCKEMRFLKVHGPELVGAIKTPTLRNVTETAPYMQAGQFKTLEEVLRRYNKPLPPYYDRKQHPSRPHFDILPLNFSEAQLADIEAFLSALTSPVPNGDPWWPLSRIEQQKASP